MTDSQKEGIVQVAGHSGAGMIVLAAATLPIAGVAAVAGGVLLAGTALVATLANTPTTSETR